MRSVRPKPSDWLRRGRQHRASCYPRCWQCKVSYSFASGGDKAQIEAKMNEAYTAVFNALGSQFKYAEIAA